MTRLEVLLQREVKNGRCFYQGQFLRNRLLDHSRLRRGGERERLGIEYLQRSFDVRIFQISDKFDDIPTVTNPKIVPSIELCVDFERRGLFITKRAEIEQISSCRFLRFESSASEKVWDLNLFRLFNVHDSLKIDLESCLF